MKKTAHKPAARKVTAKSYVRRPALGAKAPKPLNKPPTRETSHTETVERENLMREFADEELPATTDEDATSHVGLTRDPSEPPSIDGKQIPDREKESPQTTVERLVVEGVTEADREQMREGRRRKRNDVS